LLTALFQRVFLCIVFDEGAISYLRGKYRLVDGKHALGLFQVQWTFNPGVLEYLALMDVDWYATSFILTHKPYFVLLFGIA
jgi:hypothetical protein